MGYIDFERHECLNFFDDEIILEEEAGIFKYSIQYENRMHFSFYISIHDQFVAIRFKHHNLEKAIFDIGIENVGHITCDQQNLYIYKAKDFEHLFPGQDINLIKPFLTVQVKPSVAVQLSI